MGTTVSMISRESLADATVCRQHTRPSLPCKLLGPRETSLSGVVQEMTPHAAFLKQRRSWD